MMIDEKETVNPRECVLNCSMEFTIEADDNDNGELLLDGSSGGVSIGYETSTEGIQIYKRKKRRKMSDSDEIMKSKFDDKIKEPGDSAPDQNKHILSSDAFTNGPGEGSHRHCSNSVLNAMHHPLDGHENGLGGYYQENGCMSVVKKSVNNIERSENQTNGSALEGSTISELCFGGLYDILNSDKFSELRGLLLKNFGVANVNQVLDIDVISLKIKNGVYETSPILYFKDIQQVWTKLQQVGNEMVALANSLSDKSRAQYEQFVRKPRAAEAHGCQGCGEKAEVKDCLVCDSCEDVYHLSCSDIKGTEIPPLSWYCARCVSNGMGSPHDNCIVCEKLKSINGVPTTNQSQDAPNGSNQHPLDVTDEKQSSNICFICKSEVKIGDDFRTCGHSLCVHKLYHRKCLTNKQLGVSGPYWYCPSCICKRCYVDKDDDQIVLCDGCDEAYHIYCTIPQLHSIPKGSWFCGKCDRELKRIKTMRRVYESLQKKVKIEEGSEKAECDEVMNEREGLDMLVNAAKTLSNRDTFWNTQSSIL